MNKLNSINLSDNNSISLSVPKICGNEWKYIKECLDTNWVSSAGKYVEKFEKVVSNYLGRRYAVACVNGTAALHISLLVAGILPEEEVLVPALTFIAPANAVCYVGAWPVFIDAEPETWQMDPQKVKDFLTKECIFKKKSLINRATKRKVKAILPVHILGHPVDIDPIIKIARRFNLVVIEDAAESLGAKYKNRSVGALADIGCLSFNGNKIITTGGGGMILTDNLAWAKKAQYLTTQAKDDKSEYIHNEIGYNYRLTNIQAAMGVAQMENLDSYVAKKRSIAKRYSTKLNGISGITFQKEAPWANSTFWLYTLLVDPKNYACTNRELLNKLKKNKIESRLLWCPLHRLEPFKKCFAYKISVADKLYEEGLSLPSSVGLTAQQQDKVIEVIKLIIKR